MDLTELSIVDLKAYNDLAQQRLDMFIRLHHMNSLNQRQLTPEEKHEHHRLQRITETLNVEIEKRLNEIIKPTTK